MIDKAKQQEYFKNLAEELAAENKQGEKSMFDITAPIERQRSNGKKVLAIMDSGVECEYPLAVWVADGSVSLRARDGRVGVNLSSIYDLYTMPAEVADEVRYTNIYLDGFYAVSYATEKECVVGRGANAVATTKMTLNLSSGKCDAKMIWRKQ